MGSNDYLRADMMKVSSGVGRAPRSNRSRRERHDDAISHGPNYGRAFLGFVLALLLGAAAFAVFVRHATTGALGRIATLMTGRVTTFDTSVPVVVEKMQRLSRLETVVYSLDTVVEGQRSTPLLPDALAGDRILLVVHGQSIAGIDLAQLKPEDVRIDDGGRGIHVTLPPSKLFSTALDEQHTRVYERTTGLLVAADQNLETETRAKAQCSRRRYRMAFWMRPGRMRARPLRRCCTRSVSRRWT